MLNQNSFECKCSLNNHVKTVHEMRNYSAVYLAKYHLEKKIS